MVVELVSGLLHEVGLPVALTDRVELIGDIRPYATPFPVVECAASVLGAIGAAASLLWEERTGETQPVTVARGHAGASLVGFQLQRLEGGDLPPAPMSRERPLVKLYRCRDGRWVHLQGQFAHLGARTCDVLGCAVDSGVDVVAERVARWDAPALEDALARGRDVRRHGAHGRGVGGPCPGRGHRTAGPGQHREDRGERSRSTQRRARRPLEGVRVLDLSRLLAGPINARTLAEHGAEVLLVNSARLENIPLFVMDTSHGKRSACLELHDPDDAAVLRRLAAEADVFTQGYRAGSLARRGFGPEELAELRPGIIVVTHQLLRRRRPLAAPPGLGADGPDHLGHGDRSRRCRPPRAASRRGV